MNNKEIIDNAPSGATHVEIESCGGYEYWRLKDSLFEWYHFCSMTQDFIYSYQNVDSESIEDIHSLADIRRIAELEKVLNLTHKYLLLRAEVDSDGCKVVDLSSSIWIKLSKAKGGAK
jgi:hypothetical protein